MIEKIKARGDELKTLEGHDRLQYLVDIAREVKPLAEGGIYSDATLTVLNSKNIAKTEIRFQNLYPTSLGSLSYDVKASDVDYLQALVSFNYMYYEIVQISST